MIELQHLTKTYQTNKGIFTALEDINLQVAPGEIFGIIGHSGAGKSTLIHCVNMLETPSHGKVIIDNAELSKMSGSQLRQARRKIGMIFQSFNLLSSRTVYENICLPLEIDKQSAKQINKIVTPLLELTNLLDKSDAYPQQLSGGQKQRVAIARALANNPRVLLCDEATSSLDPESTRSILNLLHDIKQKLNLTILLITHEMDAIKQICDRVAILHQGKLLEQASVVDFFIRPQTAIAKDFIKSSIRQELPYYLQKLISQDPTSTDNPIYRISFQGHAATEPIIAQLMLLHNLSVNILQANIEFIHEELMGIMLIELSGSVEAQQNGLKFLQSKGLIVEYLGHVARNNYIAA